ncbi:MAG: T9SS C-terminal target domain-containing protein [Sphingobacteriales bacterium]|nr:MAG: T9SS C-terminal target domain-containing protein [Sphingobacteriales bacterium]
MKKICIALMAMVLVLYAQAQKRIVLMGSSTAAGTGASATQFSLFGRLETFYNTHTWHNIAVPGRTTAQALNIAVSGNIYEALDWNPDIILASYPSNDVANGFTNTETINNLINLQTIAAAEGVEIFFLGTQPRDFADEARRTQLSTQNDLILSTFTTKSINVYPQLFRTGGYIGFDVRYVDGNNIPDGIHVNDVGHGRIFDAVVANSIFNNLLPIVIRDFRVEIQDRLVLLRWQAKADMFHDFVGVEKSVDGQHFSEIGKVKPNVQVSATGTYRFEDRQPAIGRNYYRLALVDKNGRKEFTKTVQVNNVVTGSISAYPVPASEVLHLKTVQSAKASISITITDLTGRTLYSTTRTGEKGINAFTIPIAQLSNGMYMVRVVSPDDTNTLRFIKQ